MVRIPKQPNDCTMNIKLKSGEEFHNMDITHQPFGEEGNMVAFWYNDKVRIYPLADVEFVEFCYGL